MRYWWSNQKLTYSREVGGGYFWCRQRKSNGAKNPFYDAVRLARAGDVVFAYCRANIRAVGLVLSSADEAPHPEQVEDTGRMPGWLVKVAWLELKHPLRPMDHFETLKPLLPKNYSPLSLAGKGGQGGRLMPLPPPLARALAGLAGGIMPEPPPDTPDAPGNQLKFAFQTRNEKTQEE